MGNDNNDRQEKDFIKGSFREFGQYSLVSVWIPKDEIQRILKPDGSLSIIVAKKKDPTAGKGSHYAFVNHDRQDRPQQPRGEEEDGRGQDMSRPQRQTQTPAQQAARFTDQAPPPPARGITTEADKNNIPF